MDIKKYKFTNDYSEGCHPSILQALSISNMEQETGYGDDSHSIEASAMIKQLIQDESASVHFVSGGTIANLVVLASVLKPFESVIAADTGHINTHEAGAIEATGHKIETVKTKDGKLRVEDIEPLLNKFPLYHTVRPRLVYISNSTEIGTLYTKRELVELSRLCKSLGLILFMDGARLASALTAELNDLTLVDIASLVDVFYIGGTKSGALLGEAIVITNDSLKEDFAYHIKQRGAMMAKGRVLGIQFSTLLRNNLMFDLAQHANVMAKKIADHLISLGYSFYSKPETNQIFPILPYSLIERLREKYDFYVWDELDESKAAIRIITSWATDEKKVEEFIEDVRLLG